MKLNFIPSTENERKRRETVTHRMLGRFSCGFQRSISGIPDYILQKCMREWSKIPQELFQVAVDSVPNRLRAVIVAKEGYIE